MPMAVIVLPPPPPLLLLLDVALAIAAGECTTLAVTVLVMGTGKDDGDNAPAGVLSAGAPVASNLDMTNCMAGVTQVPQEHCAPDQFQDPTLTEQRGFGHTSLPSKSSAIELIHTSGSLKKSEEHALLPPRW